MSHLSSPGLPIGPPEYDREADLDEQERFVLPPELRPTQHDFEPQHGTDECRHCGMPYSFGGLHPTELSPDLPVLEPVFCDRCGHSPHVDPCLWRRTLHVGVQGRKVQVCGCTEVAA